MQTLKSQSQFFKFVIYFYRILGVTFSGISWDTNGNVIQSTFWYHFGWLGFVIYTIPITLFIIASTRKEKFQSMDLTVFWAINVIWYLVACSMILSILIIHHKYGFEIFKMLTNHSLSKFTKLVKIKIIWIAHLIIFLLIFIFQSSYMSEANYIFFAIVNNLMLMPLYYSISFISWIASTNFTEDIKIVRKHLIENAVLIKHNDLIQAKNFMSTKYKNMNKIDEFLSFGFLTSAIGIVLNIMASVYIGLFAYKLNLIKKMFAITLVFQVQQLIQLILNCFINGNVYEETIKLLSHLDNININANDDQFCKALILLRTSINKTKCGFTIGGFAPWNKLTLLQVTLLSY